MSHGKAKVLEPDGLRLAVGAIESRKGEDLLVLDVRDVNDATDFFVIVTVWTRRHLPNLTTP